MHKSGRKRQPSSYSSENGIWCLPTQIMTQSLELRRAINVRNMFKRKYDKCKSTGHWQQYRNQRNLVTKLRRKKYEHMFCAVNVVQPLGV